MIKKFDREERVGLLLMLILFGIGFYGTNIRILDLILIAIAGLILGSITGARSGR
jgi:hypothetical protein